MVDVVVIGAGLAGLAAGVGLARGGHAVTILERDAQTAPPIGGDPYLDWDRPGTPQAPLHHGFLGRARNELEQHAPGVVEMLLSEGAAERIFNLPGDEPDALESVRVVTARRAVVEWALRRYALETPGLRVLAGEPAAGLVLAERPVPRVAGVRLDGETLAAQLVVDAAGRRSPVRGWLSASGVGVPESVAEACGIAYASRYFRLRDGVDFPELRTPLLEPGNLGYIGYAIGQSDARTYSLLFAFPTGDRTWRPLGNTDAWDAAASMIERMSVYTDPETGSPLTDVRTMYGLENTLTPWFVDGAPVLRGLVAIGDAWSTTDPLFGWGASFALAHGFGVGRAVADHGDDIDSALESFYSAFHEEARQRFETSCNDGRARLEHWKVVPPSRSAQEIEREALLFGLGRVARSDPRAVRALVRRAHLLDLPDEIWSDDELVAAMDAAIRERPFDPTRALPGPTRSELVGAIESVQ